jgi:hypothetical protein
MKRETNSRTMMLRPFNMTEGIFGQGYEAAAFRDSDPCAYAPWDWFWHLTNSKSRRDHGTCRICGDRKVRDRKLGIEWCSTCAQ